MQTEFKRKCHATNDVEIFIKSFFGLPSEKNNENVERAMFAMQVCANIRALMLDHGVMNENAPIK